MIGRGVRDQQRRSAGRGRIEHTRGHGQCPERLSAPQPYDLVPRRGAHPCGRRLGQLRNLQILGILIVVAPGKRFRVPGPVAQQCGLVQAFHLTAAARAIILMDEEQPALRDVRHPRGRPDTAPILGERQSKLVADQLQIVEDLRDGVFPPGLVVDQSHRLTAILVSTVFKPVDPAGQPNRQIVAYALGPASDQRAHNRQELAACHRFDAGYGVIGGEHVVDIEPGGEFHFALRPFQGSDRHVLGVAERVCRIASVDEIAGDIRQHGFRRTVEFHRIVPVGGGIDALRVSTQRTVDRHQPFRHRRDTALGTFCGHGPRHIETFLAAALRHLVHDGAETGVHAAGLGAGAAAFQ